MRRLVEALGSTLVFCACTYSSTIRVDGAGATDGATLDAARTDAARTDGALDSAWSDSGRLDSARLDALTLDAPTEPSDCLNPDRYCALGTRCSAERPGETGICEPFGSPGDPWTGEVTVYGSAGETSASLLTSHERDFLSGSDCRAGSTRILAHVPEPGTAFAYCMHDEAGLRAASYETLSRSPALIVWAGLSVGTGGGPVRLNLAATSDPMGCPVTDTAVADVRLEEGWYRATGGYIDLFPTGAPDVEYLGTLVATFESPTGSRTVRFDFRAPRAFLAC